MPYQIGPTGRRKLLAVSVALLLSACATTPPEPTFIAPVYPPPPDEPRFVFERTLRYSSNVKQTTTMERLRRFATGEQGDIQGLVKPFGVAAYQGRVYVTDTAQKCVILFDITGARYKEFGHEKPGALFKPIALDISPEGEVFVADVSARRIAVYDLEGGFKRFIGTPKRLKRPSGVAVSPDGKRVYVIDTGGVDTQDHHLHIYDSQGKHLATVGKRGNKPGEFNLPLQVTTAPDGTVYVVDKGNFRVQSFDAAGKYLGGFGSIGRYPGQFFSPKGISIDKEGNIYVVDTAFGNVQIFNAQQQLLMVIGQRGQSSAPGNYMLPAGIDVDQDGKVYVVDQFFRKVDIYRPAAVELNAPKPSP